MGIISKREEFIDETPPEISSAYLRVACITQPKMRKSARVTVAEGSQL